MYHHTCSGESRWLRGTPYYGGRGQCCVNLATSTHHVTRVGHLASLLRSDVWFWFAEFVTASGIRDELASHRRWTNRGKTWRCQVIAV